MDVFVPWSKRVFERRPRGSRILVQMVDRVHRVRKEVVGNARFLTFSCHQRLPLLDEDWTKDLFIERLGECRRDMGFKLLGWVVMPEHVHLVVVPDLPEHPVPEILKALKELVSRGVFKRWDAQGSHWPERLTDSRGKRRFWLRGGGFDRNVRDEGELRAAIRYMHENPVKRGLCGRPEEWVWSSARAWAGEEGVALNVDRGLL